MADPKELRKWGEDGEEGVCCFLKTIVWTTLSCTSQTVQAKTMMEMYNICNLDDLILYYGLGKWLSHFMSRVTLDGSGDTMLLIFSQT